MEERRRGRRAGRKEGMRKELAIAFLPSPHSWFDSVVCLQALNLNNLTVFMIGDQTKKHLHNRFQQWGDILIIFTCVLIVIIFFNFFIFYYFTWRETRFCCFLFMPGYNFSNA